MATSPTPTKLTLSVKDAWGSAPLAIPLDIDASASTETILVLGLPDGAKLSAGSNPTPGAWTLQQNDLAGLKLALPPGHSGDLTLQIIAQDSRGDTAQRTLAVKIGPAEFTPGTRNQKIGVFLFLLLSTIALLGIWFSRFATVQSVASAEVSVSWDEPTGVSLKSGPPLFRYDADSKKLFFRGLMDANQKEELVKLITVTGTDSQAQSNAAGYQGAIDQLAYLSNYHRDNLMLGIFILGGISGIAGILMRSLFNFVRVSCFENKFDWHRWWPWYVVRPILGFFLGLVCVLFVEADLFQPSGKSTAGLAWWIGIAILAGFAADDFVEKIRLIGQTLFGDASRGSK